MPGHSPYCIQWIQETNHYQLIINGRPAAISLDSPAWFNWLDTITSFSFLSQPGKRYTIRQEKMRRGGAYWYAYQSTNGKTVKRYLGKTVELTTQKLVAVPEMFPSTNSEITDVLPGQTAGNAKHFSAYVNASETSATNDAWFPLLASKFYPPRPNQTLLARTRLLTRLDFGLRHPLTLITAPTGFGKTSLMSQWLHDDHSGITMPPVAWITLDAQDNDPIRFWRSLMTACQLFHKGLGDAALAQLLSTESSFLQPSVLEAIITGFLNEIVQSDCSGILIFDDYSMITEAQVHQTLTFFLQHLPPSIHIFLITRSEPPLPLSHWRTRGELNELGVTDLRFTADEVQTLLVQMTSFTISDALLTQLTEYMEGWATGLRLLALELRGQFTQPEIEQHIRAFLRFHRPMQDYFIQEVLFHQPEALQTFLLATCMLTRLNGSLCDAATNREGSTLLLAAIEKAGLFLERLDGPEQWYRYTTPFAEALRIEAQRQLGTETLQQISRRESLWYEAHHMLNESIESAFTANDYERAVTLIEQHLEALPHNRMHELHTLHAWIARIPRPLLQQHPQVYLSYLVILFFTSSGTPFPADELSQLSTLLDQAEKSFQKQHDVARLSEIHSFKALVAIRQGQWEQALSAARQAYTLLAPDQQYWGGINLSTIGSEALQAGQLDVAYHMFLEARAFWQSRSHQHGTRGTTLTLGDICWWQGALHQAAEQYRQALHNAIEQDDQTDHAHAQLGLAQLSYEWNDFTAVEQALHAIEALDQTVQSQEILSQTGLLQVQMLLARQQPSLAYQRLAALLAHASVVSQGIPSPSYLRLRLCQIRYYLVIGDLPSAQQHFAVIMEPNDKALPFLLQEQREIMRGRLLLAQGDAPGALAHLSTLLSAAQAAGRHRHALEIQLVLAQAHAAHKHSREALSVLQALLVHAQPEGFIRTILDEGQPIVTLLQELLLNVHDHTRIASIRHLLQVATNKQAPNNTTTVDDTLIEPLSPQEHRVLHLLVAGRSNPEIAREQVVSINTVKAQVQSIYRKLNVNNRVEASELARKLELL